jgi:hypothetical protein
MREISESYRYIIRTPDVRGGYPRVEGTRFAIHDVIGLLQNGETVDSITGTCLTMLTKAQRPAGNRTAWRSQPTP